MGWLKSKSFAVISALTLAVLLVCATLIPISIYCEPERPEDSKINTSTATEQKTPSEDKSPVIKLLQAIDEHQKATYKSYATEKQHQSWSRTFWCEIKITDFLLALFTLALVFVTGGLIWTGLRQEDVLKKSIASAEKSADAAEKSANVTSATLVITQRAWVVSRHFRTRIIRDEQNAIKEWAITVLWRNEGNGIARNTIISSGLHFVEAIPIGPITHGEGAAGTVLGPRGGEFDTVVQPRITAEQMRKIADGTLAAYIVGLATYNDIFANTPLRTTSMCVQVRSEIKDPSQQEHIFYFPVGTLNHAD